ncbi:MAG: LysR family transcriptional regulator [Gemmobacter sp.]
MINLTFLETFVWVARLGSFTRAAERVGTTQAAVAARIAALEDELGVQLLIRENRRLKLTHEGIQALSGAEQLLNSARGFVEEVTGQDRMRGTVRIGVIDTITYTWLIDLMRVSRRRFPGLGIELLADTSLRLIDALRTGDIELALIMGPVPDPNFVNLELCSYACHWVAAPELGLAGRQLGAKELAELPLISFPKGSQPYGYLDRHFRNLGHRNPVIYAGNSLASIIRLAVDGLGVATIPPVVAPRELARGELVLLSADQPIPPMRMHAVYLDGPSRDLPATMAGLARDVAHDFLRRSDPELAWDRALQATNEGPK